MNRIRIIGGHSFQAGIHLSSCKKTLRSRKKRDLYTKNLVLLSEKVWQNKCFYGRTYAAENINKY